MDSRYQHEVRRNVVGHPVQELQITDDGAFSSGIGETPEF
jgi:hypothetical protein